MTLNGKNALQIDETHCNVVTLFNINGYKKVRSCSFILLSVKDFESMQFLKLTKLGKRKIVINSFMWNLNWARLKI